MEEHVDGRELHAVILNAYAPDEAEALRKSVAHRFDSFEQYVTEPTPVMGVHTGPGSLGVAALIE